VARLSVIFGLSRRLIALLSALVVLVTIAGFFFELTQGPSIEPSVGTANDPFSLKFTIRNPTIITLHNMDFACFLISADGQSSNGRKIKFDDNLVQETAIIDLKPFEKAQLVCPLEQAVLIDWKVNNVRAKIGTRFQRFGFWSQSWSEMMSWDSASRQWTEGKPIN
jgi:hypothetical protein